MSSNGISLPGLMNHAGGTSQRAEKEGIASEPPKEIMSDAPTHVEMNSAVASQTKRYTVKEETNMSLLDQIVQH